MTQPDQRRLNVLMTLRRRQEEQVRAEFESAKADADLAEAQVRRLKALLDAHNADAREAILHRPTSMSLYRQAEAELTASLSDATRLLAATRAQLEQRRKALCEAMQERKAAESVRGRVVAQAAAQEYRLATKTADDMHAAHSAAKGADGAK